MLAANRGLRPDLYYVYKSMSEKEALPPTKHILATDVPYKMRNCAVKSHLAHLQHSITLKKHKNKKLFESLEHKTGIDLTVSSTLKKPSKKAFIALGSLDRPI